MTQACSFDSSDSLEESDCISDCFNLGCNVELLENLECNESCNFPECGWDGGDCGYCS